MTQNTCAKLHSFEYIFPLSGYHLHTENLNKKSYKQKLPPADNEKSMEVCFCVLHPNILRKRL